METKIHADVVDLLALLENAVACTDKQHHTLAAVQLYVTDHELWAVATDSHVLIRQTMSVDAGGDLERLVCVPGSLLVDVVRALKAAKRGSVNITIHDETIDVAVGAAIYADRLAQVDYPRHEGLWPTESAPVVGVALAGKQLVRLGKLKGEGPNPLLRLTFVSDLKPVVFRVGSTIDGLVMPCRVPC